ncbi:hypothetical protein BDN70DRAFT_275101 [Pholiota conissans]|uniref:F-box domain-containing protein n=1 Tax=Pholiota conissans TaxID=109636 RepID=A0A9P6CQJ0_9AGAR|nr:hypothetical protein BDN70DRAFT_275101 [Pholiota conissans]
MSDFCHYCNYQARGVEFLCNPSASSACAPCQTLSEIDQKIKETRRMLIGLAKERQELKKQANHNHDRIIHHLPLEVASKIFELSMPWDVEKLDIPRASKYAISAPFILSSVCRRWRDIAHSTPQLWANLIICDRNPHFCTLPAPSIVEDMIVRARNFPLSIIFYGIYESNQAVAIRKIIYLLARHSKRWADFRYEGPSQLLSYLPTDDEDLPLLRRLHLTVTHGSGVDVNKTSFNLRVRRLNALSITGVRLEADNLDWNNLQKLELSLRPQHECFEALMRAPNLTRCILRQIPYTFSQFHPKVPIRRPSLQHLEITDGYFYQFILKSFIYPSLSTLVLGSNKIAFKPIPLIVEYINKSECALESLSLLNTEVVDSDIGALCNGIPTLQYLQISLSNTSSTEAAGILSAHLAEFFVIDGRKKPRYLPDLRSLILTMSKDLQPDWSDLRLLPDIFGTPMTTDTANGSASRYATERHRHALESVSISVNRFDRMKKPELYDAIGRQTLERIVWLRSNAGVRWTLRIGKDGEDVIGPALDWFKMKSSVD